MKKSTEPVKVSVVCITPQLAADMLQRNTLNRAITNIHVKRLSQEMLEGRWKLNGDSIRFSGDRLIDGQHRLWAVVESGITIESLVVDGLEDGVFDTIDIGKNRSHADTLSVMGVYAAKSTAAALKVIERYQSGRLASTPRLSNAEVIGLFVRHHAITRSVQVCGYQAGLVPASMLIAFHYLASIKSVEEADMFVKDMKSGAGLSQDDPVFRLRERFISLSCENRATEKRCDYVFACFIRAWNARRAGRTLKRLQISNEDLRSETFQEIN